MVNIKDPTALRSPLSLPGLKAGVSRGKSDDYQQALSRLNRASTGGPDNLWHITPLTEKDYAAILDVTHIIDCLFVKYGARDGIVALFREEDL